MSNPDQSSKGKRYTSNEKARILEYAALVDSQNNGRGGLAAASKKYGVSVLSVSLWRRRTGSKPRKSTPPKPGLFKELEEVHLQIVEAEIVLRRMRRHYDTLKSQV